MSAVIQRADAFCLQLLRLIYRDEIFKECKMLAFQIWMPVREQQ
jgi:hypothetical protein